MVKENKMTLIVSIVVVALFIIGVVATSYAYFTTNIAKENAEDNKIDVTTATIGAKFIDGETINIANMIPGDQFDKTFTLENTGSEAIKYKIIIRDVENTFQRKEDIEVVVKEDGNIIKTTVFPSTTGSISDELIINPNTTKSYTITITYINQLDIDQSFDMESKISGTIFIEEV